MNFKKTVAIAAAAGALAAISVPAMALENEFHGMYKFIGYQSNFYNGVTQGFAVAPRSGFFAEQRARLQYTAKANNDLKLVTHFELDSRFGGKAAAYLGTASGNDAGNLDADQLTLETKHVFLDFNAANTNFKVGIQPWADAYQGVFLLADMSGVVVTKKIGAATLQGGWFRLDDDTAIASDVAKLKNDFFIANGKFAINKDITVGASLYNGVRKNATAPATGGNAWDELYMYGVDADIKAGPASIKPFLAIQRGDKNATNDLKGGAAGVVAKIKMGSNAINLSGLYLSGDKSPTTATQEKAFVIVGPSQSYFNAANMWLLVRSAQGINTSSSVLANDITAQGHGLVGLFAGFEGTAGKVFYNANLGYAQAAQVQTATEKKQLGTEINAQVGYKLFDNMSVSAAAAYVALGKGLDGTAAETIGTFGIENAENPYMANIQLSYAF